MNRQITVKGTGRVSLKPDLVVITMTLESLHREYDQAMSLAAGSVDALAAAIEASGFTRGDLKTVSFNVRTQYKSYHDKNNNYRNRFEGYVCEHGLKLEFDFDNQTLSRTLSAITRATANPRLNIQFSVKDQAAVSAALLINATENARSTAKTLAQAAGVSLGDLISIDYNWSELQLYSPARYEMEERCMSMDAGSAPAIEPDDIDVKDTVTFVWAIGDK